MPALVVKVTEKCNANCEYCYVVHKPTTRGTMLRSIAQLLFTRINEYLNQYPDESIDVVWHGGEPLLAGTGFFARLNEFQDTLCANTKARINHSIQTNLTLLNEKFVELFRELGVQSIGTSVDPFTGLRGVGKNNNAAKYNEMVFRALDIVKRSDLRWGIIYVVTRQALTSPMKIFLYLSNLAETSAININPVLQADNARKKNDYVITPQEYAQFLGTIFPFWWQHKELYSNVQPFQGLVDSIINNQVSQGCMDFGVCDSTSRHINIEPDGDAYLSGFMTNDAACYFGNLAEHSIADLLSCENLKLYISDIKQSRQVDCADCRFNDLCFAGVSEHAYNSSLMKKSEWCKARHQFMNEYFEPVTGVHYESRTASRI